MYIKILQFLRKSNLKQTTDIYYVKSFLIGGELMPFYPPNRRNRPFPPTYRQDFGPPYQSMQEQPFYYPPQQPPVSRFGRLPANLNTIMGHAGRISNGVNMVRQMGSLIRFFR